MHLFGGVTGVAALSGCGLGGDGGHYDRLHRKIARGNFGRNSAVAERAADSHGVAGNPELSFRIVRHTKLLARSADPAASLCGPARAGRRLLENIRPEGESSDP